MTRTESPRKIRFSDPTHCFDNGKVLWNAGLLFRPTDEPFDLNLPFSTLPESAPPVEIATEFVMALIEERIPDHPSKKIALDELTISGTREPVAKARKTGVIGSEQTALGIKINDDTVIVVYPTKSNLSTLGAHLSDGNLLNELNAYAHGIVELITSQARSNLLAGSKALLDALDKLLPITDNYLNSELEELRREVRELREALQEDRLDRHSALRFLGNLTKRFAEGIARAAGSKAFEQIWPMIAPYFDKLTKWLLLKIGVS